MKRIALAGGLVVLLLAGVAAGYVLYRKHQQRNVTGSPTVEFVTTRQERTRPPEDAGLQRQCVAAVSCSALGDVSSLTPSFTHGA